MRDYQTTPEDEALDRMFRQRDARARNVTFRRPEDFSEPQPAPVYSGEGGMHVEEMRRIHDGAAYAPGQGQSCGGNAAAYTGSAMPYGGSGQPYGETALPYGGEVLPSADRGHPAPGSTRPPRRRKKHRLLRFFLILLCLVLLAGALLIGSTALTAKMPHSGDGPGPRREGCAAILLCGTDGDGTRTDTMLLLYLDRKEKAVRLLSLPRDTKVNRDNPVPKLNGAYGANGKGEKGMGFLLDYVKDLVGYRPDGYLMLDLDCFESLVDQMGGVDFDVPMDMHYEDKAQDLFIDLKEGKQHLTGEEAMWLVRFRKGYITQDLERTQVQRDFLASAFRQWLQPKNAFRLPKALKILQKNSMTDLNYNNFCWIGWTLAACKGSEIEHDILPGNGSPNGGVYYLEDRQAAAELINEKYNPYEREVTADDLHPYGY